MSDTSKPAAPLDLSRPTRAKIVATLGPASESADMVRRLVEAGVAAFRLNFSHGSFADHQKRLEAVRGVARQMHRPIAVFGDLCGPKIRVGVVPEGGLDLHSGQQVVFRRGLKACALERTGVPGGSGGSGGAEPATVVLATTYPPLIDEVAPGHRVLINDGAIRMLAVERLAEKGELHCRVTLGGLVTTGKGINLPDTDVTAPSITARDWECVEWAVQHGLDFLALSFVRSAAEVLELKAKLATMCAVDKTAEDAAPGQGACIPVIAKIEKPQAVAAMDEVIQAADAIMVARGDLGVEMDIAQVPVVQKKLVARCQAWGKPCIVATQMLETMIQNSTPTRAEASDVANAVFDGADAVMLSGETAVGKHPALVVETMRRIIAGAEAWIGEQPYEEAPPLKLVESGYATAALAHGAWHVARDIGAKLIVCWSQAGGTARYLSQNDFRVPVIAYTSSVTAARRMTLLKGVTPIRTEAPPGLGAFTDLVERDMVLRGWIGHGEPLVLLAGKPLGTAKATNSMAVLYVGDPNGGYRAHRS